MRLRSLLMIPLLGAATILPAYADHISVDYNHAAHFTTIKTYSWSAVHTTDAIWDARVKDAISRQLAARGWVQVPANGDVELVAVEKVAIQQQYDETYDGFGGRRWGGMGESTLSVDNYKVGTLIVCMFDEHSRQLIWKGSSSGDLTGNPEKNTKKLDSDVQKMFKEFPPRTTS